MDGEITHVARQLPNGRWASKISGQEDIEHDHPDELDNDIPYGYGKVSIYLKKLNPALCFVAPKTRRQKG